MEGFYSLFVDAAYLRGVVILIVMEGFYSWDVVRMRDTRVVILIVMEGFYSVHEAFSIHNRL